MGPLSAGGDLKFYPGYWFRR